MFGNDAYAINYYCQVLEVRDVYRWQLFPGERQDEKASQRYYQLMLGPLQHLPHPIPSLRLRRIVFIPTRWRKLISAEEINDLFDDSPLENDLWSALKRLEIRAERQEVVKIKGRHYILDFAVHCVAGKLNIETDGDIWHTSPERVPKDNLRDNDLETSGWSLLRFNTLQLREQMTDYCLPTIAEKIRKLHGIAEGRMIPRPITLSPSELRQLSLFDDAP